MNRFIVAASVLLLSGLPVAAQESPSEETVFGPEQYVRTSGNPDVYTASFEGVAGRAATLHVTSGDNSRQSKETSGTILVNGVQVIAPDDFKPNVASLNADIKLEAANTIRVELAGSPGSFVTVEVTASWFFEKTPGWRMPDLALANLLIEPDRADPGDQVVFHATVASVDSGPTESAELRFLLGGSEVCSSDVEPLGPGAATDVLCTWTADIPGRHTVVARLVIDPGATDFSSENDEASAIVRVSGEQNPLPELELRPDFDPMDIVPGQPFTFTITARNPSFAEITSLPLSFLVDDELIVTDFIEDLFPGEKRTLNYTWASAEPGQHIVTVRPEGGDDPILHAIQYPILSIANILVYHPKQLYSTMQKDKWVSIGPREIAGGSGLPGGSVGRVDAIAFDPYDPQRIMYAAPYRGGLWKTVNGGARWDPLTDGLPTLLRGAVAIHPKLPGTIYYGTGYYNGGDQGLGVFKSMDGGAHWTNFVRRARVSPSLRVPIKVVEKIIVRDTQTGVLIYAATDQGVLRYLGKDVADPVSDPNDWTVIKSGMIWDLAVNPKNNSEVYASLFHGGLFRTTNGETATGDGNWTEVLPRPAGSTGHFEFDVYWDQPKTIWAALDKPGPGFSDKLVIYRWRDNGDGWKVRYGFNPDGLNEFIRVHPTDPDEIYFGAVDLHWCQGNCGDSWTIKGVHADQKDFQWDPLDDDVFWVTNDGGVFRCEWTQVYSGFFKKMDYACQPRNFNMRITQFYDFDSSPTDPNMMIGGTQDNGTLLYTGDPDAWKWVKGGDGYYALIAPGNDVLFGQWQRLNDTKACEDGTDCGPKDWDEASAGLPSGWQFRDSQIAKDPLDQHVAYSIGPEVFATFGPGFFGNWQWFPQGPTASDGLGPGDKITRIAVHPQRIIIAGTKKGEIWAKSSSIDWKKIFSVGLLDPAWQPSSNYTVHIIDVSAANPDHLYVVFAADAEALRIFKLHINPSLLSLLDARPIAHAFPFQNRWIKSIAGDGHKVDTVYVGTDKGVFKGEPTCSGCPWFWKDYSDGLPYVEIKDLLVDPTSKELRAASFGRGAWSVITGP